MPEIQHDKHGSEPVPMTYKSPRKVRVLIIEDNLKDVRLTESMLKKAQDITFNTAHVVRMDDAISYLSNHPETDLILSDISLPDAQGSETFTMLRKAAANLPVVFITGTHDEDLAEAALQKGAQDYLLKGRFDEITLHRSVRYAIERKKFETSAKKARAKARELRMKTMMLKHQNRQLEQLNEAKDDFISMASHQLRTPATGVKQYIGMLIEGFAGTLTERQQKIAASAYESNERQLRTVDDLLMVAQIDAGKLQLHDGLDSVDEMLASIIADYSERTAERKQMVTLQADSNIPLIHVDSRLIRMVFENLIDNASKYTPDGKCIKIYIHKDDNAVITEVKDEGVGIEKKDQQKLFQKFSRIQNPLSGSVSGTGLGLYWVKKVIDVHQGTIHLESAVGKGSCFRVCLPMQRD